MEFFNQAIDILKILVMALGAGLAVWGVINLLEGYGSDNPAAKSQGIKQLMACGIVSKQSRFFCINTVRPCGDGKSAHTFGRKRFIIQRP